MKSKAEAPRFDINDQVWFRESAIIGHLESYRVANIIYDREYNNWMYQLNLLNDSPLNTHNAAHNRHAIYIEESDLLTYCEAVDIVRKKIISDLDELYILKSKCPGTE